MPPWPTARTKAAAARRSDSRPRSPASHRRSARRPTRTISGPGRGRRPRTARKVRVWPTLPVKPCRVHHSGSSAVGNDDAGDGRRCHGQPGTAVGRRHRDPHCRRDRAGGSPRSGSRCSRPASPILAGGLADRLRPAASSVASGSASARRAAGQEMVLALGPPGHGPQQVGQAVEVAADLRVGRSGRRHEQPLGPADHGPGQVERRRYPVGPGNDEVGRASRTGRSARRCCPSRASDHLGGHQGRSRLQLRPLGRVGGHFGHQHLQVPLECGQQPVQLGVRARPRPGPGPSRPGPRPPCR